MAICLEYKEITKINSRKKNNKKLHKTGLFDISQFFQWEEKR